MLTVHVLGPVEVRRAGVPVDLGGPQQRAVIAHLALEAGRVVSVERLVDRLWGDEPPRTPLGTLQSYVSRLRRVLEPARGPGAAPRVLVSEAPGYVLRVSADDVDVHHFTRLVSEARAAAADGDPARAVEHLDEGLALWRGPALAGVGPDDRVRPIVVRLDEERATAVEERFGCLLALGRHQETVPLLRAALDDHPLREGLWELLALALYRSSRQAEALRALSAARATLLHELGLDPGPRLRQLERRILDHDPDLLVVSPGRRREHGDATPRTPSSRIVGRADEWRSLADALEAAESDRLHLALVEGEPGIGKTTLCDAFVDDAAARGWRTAVGRCVDGGLAPALWPWVEIVRVLLREMPATEAPDALRGLASGSSAGGALTPVEIADLFVELLDRFDATGDGRWVFVLDDLHWADRASIDLLALVLARLGGRRILVVGAHRDPPGVDSPLVDGLGRLVRSAGSARVRLSPLAADDVARLMELTSGARPTPAVAERVHARAAGNPLFVTELARLAGERGLDADAVVPDAIRDVVRSRLAPLPEAAHAELQVAAVLGERFDLRVLVAASERDPDDCLDALDAAVVTRLLVPDAAGYRFAHALVRDAVLAELSPLRRARLHRRAADAMLALHGDGPDDAEPIAHHRLASVPLGDPLAAARAAVRASDVARWRGALDAADALADRALDVLATLPRTREVVRVEVEALEAIAGNAHRRVPVATLDDVARRVHEVAERTGSDAARALGLFLSWGRVDETDDLATVAEYAVRARDLAERTTDPYALVATHYIAGSHAFLTGDVAAASLHLETAIRSAGATSAHERPDHVPLVLAPVVAGIVAALRGEIEIAFEHADTRSAAWLSKRSEVDPTADVALAFNRAFVRALVDDPAGVVVELADVERSDVAGFVGQQAATCDLLASWAAVKRGNWEALADAFDAMARIDGSEERILSACLRTFVADACLDVGDRRAVELLERAERDAHARGEVWWLAEIVRLHALADRRFADGRRASELLDRAASIAAHQGVELLLPRIAASRDAGPRPAVTG